MVDIRRIEELRVEIGEEDMIAVLGVFLAEAEQVIARIARPLPEAEHAMAVHFLRSGALNLGLQSFADQAAEVATTPPSGRAEASRALLGTLRRSVALVGSPDAAA